MSPSNSHEQPNLVRIFISSTFVDMQPERDELIKYAFPKLRALCEARGISWTSVDLRWGITDEAKAEGKVLDLCFREIERCRPFFIGLLADRYGWVPADCNALNALCPACAADCEGYSVTELEINHGVLNHRETASRAFFYFRQSGTSGPREIVGGDRTASASAREESRLTKLKERIRRSGVSLREGYTSPKELGNWILTDLTKAIEQDFPSTSEADPIQTARRSHDLCAVRQSAFFIERPELFDVLDAYVASRKLPLVVTGPPGIGKSSVLSAWSNHFLRHDPDAIVIRHFVAATPSSADWKDLLVRVIRELSDVIGIGEDGKLAPHQLAFRFANVLEKLPEERPLIIMVDGLDQLDDIEGALELAWLPYAIPPNLRLILSTSEGRPLNSLTQRKYKIFRIPPLTQDEVSCFIETFLSAYGKSLPQSIKTKIEKHVPTGNPLYLRLLIEELRIYGDHYGLERHLDVYLQSDSVETLYNQILTRYEQDFERERPGLVRDAMSLLWTAHRGLSEDELLDMLGVEGERLPSAWWSPLSLATTFALREHDGLLSIAQPQLRRAVQRKYCQDVSTRLELRRKIAAYFDMRGVGPRQIEEVPYQFSESKQWDDLAALLSRPAFFEAHWHHDQFALQRYWVQLENNSEHRLVETCQHLIENPELSPINALNFSQMLRVAGHLRAALAFAKVLVSRFRSSGPRDKLAMVLTHQASVLTDLDIFDDALRLLDEAQSIGEEMIIVDDTQISVLCTALTIRALIERAKENLPAAIEIHERIEGLCRANHYHADTAEALYQQAFFWRQRGNAERAQALLDDAKQLFVAEENLTGLASILNE